jgi:hypothetical protein
MDGIFIDGKVFFFGGERSPGWMKNDAMSQPGL